MSTIKFLSGKIILPHSAGSANPAFNEQSTFQIKNNNLILSRNNELKLY